MKTMEQRKETPNGVGRLVLSFLLLAVQLVLIFLMLTKVRGYASWIDGTLKILSLITVLILYSRDQTSNMKLPWIVILLVFPVFGIGLYLLVGFNSGTERMRRRYRQVDDVLLPTLSDKPGLAAHEGAMEKLSHMDKRLSGVSAYIYRNSQYPLYNNSGIEYFHDAAEALLAQKAALVHAKKFIFMEYHAIEDTQSWREIQAILEQKAAQGVDVRVFYDDMGSIGFINTEFADRMQKKGIACRVFNPVVPVLNLFLNNRDHRKITVVDGRVGFTGGYNLADEYFNITHPYGRWKDTGVKITGAAVRSLTATFLENWYGGIKEERALEEDLNLLCPPGVSVQMENAFIQPYADSPLDDIHVGEDVYMSLIQGAQTYCYLVTPYLILTDEMVHSLALAARRGVDVRIVTPGIPDKKLVYQVTRSYYHALASKGVRIYEWTPGFCHCKMCVTDDKAAICGTINMDYRSFYHHFENGCLYMNCQAVQDTKDDFIRLFSQSAEVTKTYADGRGAIMRFGQLILRLFAPLL